MSQYCPRIVYSRCWKQQRSWSTFKGFNRNSLIGLLLHFRASISSPCENEPMIFKCMSLGKYESTDELWNKNIRGKTVCNFYLKKQTYNILYKLVSEITGHIIHLATLLSLYFKCLTRILPTRMVQINPLLWLQQKGSLRDNMPTWTLLSLWLVKWISQARF